MTRVKTKVETYAIAVAGAVPVVAALGVVVVAVPVAVTALVDRNTRTVVAAAAELAIPVAAVGALVTVVIRRASARRSGLHGSRSRDGADGGEEEDNLGEVHVDDWKMDKSL